MEIKKIKRAYGEILVPGDKSISHRAIMLGCLASGVTHIKGFLSGTDCLSTVSCFNELGIDIKLSNDNAIVYGKGLYGLKAPEKILYTGNSGTTTRLLCGILSGQKFDSILTGDASIRRRPMSRVTRPLNQMGAKIKNDYCPLYIQGSRLNGIDYTMPVASAQVKSAIILAGLYADGVTVIYEKAQSRNHTELMLHAMGANVYADSQSVKINPVDFLCSQDITVPKDISSAAFFMVLAAIMPKSQITIKKVGINPTRTGIIDVLKGMGTTIDIENISYSAGEPSADVTVYSSSLHGTNIGGNIIPALIDEIPIIAVAALFADGRTVIKDASELRVKESDRIKAIVTELKKCGADITETDDGMIINGGRALHGADFCSYNDHRMAMSLIILAQMLDGTSSIDNTDCIDISYPKFLNDLYGME